MELRRQIGLLTAVLIIIADVIGTGIFSTTGQVLKMTGSAPSVLILFAVGGLMAVTGSLCYAELAVMWPDDGGEYVYLRKIFGDIFSFLSGWISLFVAFSLSAAMSSIMVVNYLNKLVPGGVVSGGLECRLAAAGIVVFFGAVHVVGVQKGSMVQNAFTILKLLLVFAFIALGFSFVNWGESARLSWTSQATGSPLTWGTGLITIMYAYSGWNGATYIAGEIKDPVKNLPRALLVGTCSIVLIYLLMNVIYLMSNTAPDIVNKAESTIGDLAARSLFGDAAAPVFNLSIMLILLSAVSVQMMIGPRVTYAMARDRAIFSVFKRINPRFQTPDAAILVQTAVAVVYAFIGWDLILQLLIYMGFALSLFPLLTVIGMVYMRMKHPRMKRPWKVPLFPVVPVIFIALSMTVIVVTLIDKPKASLSAVGVLLVGAAIYFIRDRLWGTRGKSGTKGGRAK